MLSQARKGRRKYPFLCQWQKTSFTEIINLGWLAVHSRVLIADVLYLVTKVRSHSFRKGELQAAQWKSLLGDVRQSLPRNCGHWVNPQPTRSDNYANNFTDAYPPCAKNYSCTYQRPLVSLLGHLHLPNHLFTLPLQLSNAWQFRRQKLSKEQRQWQIQNRVLEKKPPIHRAAFASRKSAAFVWLTPMTADRRSCEILRGFDTAAAACEDDSHKILTEGKVLDGAKRETYSFAIPT